MITLDMEAENALNKVIAFKSSKDSVHKERRLKTVLYDSTLEPIETCPTWAKSMLKTLEILSFGSKTKCCVSCIKYFVYKSCLISMLGALGKRNSVNIVTSTNLTSLWDWRQVLPFTGGLEIAKTRFSDQSSLSQALVFRELLVR